MGPVSVDELAVLSSLESEFPDCFFFDWPNGKKSLILLLFSPSADVDPESDLLPSLDREVLGFRLLPKDKARRFGMSSVFGKSSADGPGGVGWGESDVWSRACPYQ
jgi:hypothetical protein